MLRRPMAAPLRPSAQRSSALRRGPQTRHGLWLWPPNPKAPKAPKALRLRELLAGASFGRLFQALLRRDGAMVCREKVSDAWLKHTAPD